MDKLLAPDRLAYRPSEVARVLGLSRSKTYELIATGELPSMKIGGSIRVPVDDLRVWIARRVEERESER